jgi:hypothetical protein
VENNRKVICAEKINESAVSEIRKGIINEAFKVT